jgi:hypothetical protein
MWLEKCKPQRHRAAPVRKRTTNHSLTVAARWDKLSHRAAPVRKRTWNTGPQSVPPKHSIPDSFERTWRNAFSS